MIQVYLTFDVDQDDATAKAERTRIEWKGIELLPEMKETLARHEMPYTFFLRCDNQIRDLYGSSLAIYERYQNLWDGMRNTGNEFAWHPHLYRLESEAYVPIRSGLEGAEVLWKIWDELRALNFPVHCVRLGEAWHSTETMRVLDEMGLKIDSTAVPGRSRHDNMRSFDWEPTSNSPYHPSLHDYRVPGGGNSLKILEVPMTTAPIKTSYDLAPLRRYLNLAYHSEMFRSWLDNYLAAIPGDALNHLVLIFHPDEFLQRPANALYAYDLKSFEQNLENLQEKLQSFGQPFRFCRLSEALQ